MNLESGKPRGVSIYSVTSLPEANGKALAGIVSSDILNPLLKSEEELRKNFGAVVDSLRPHGYSEEDRFALKKLIETDWRENALLLDDPADRRLAAQMMSLGGVAIHGFGNFYAVTSRPELQVMRYVNASKGRPDMQVASVTTTKEGITEGITKIFDFNKIPKGVDHYALSLLIKELYEDGPFGVRGPAAGGVPSHLTENDTVQIIAPGFKCASNKLFRIAMRESGVNILQITSANISHNITGAKEEPAHWKIKGIQEQFGRIPGYFMVQHNDEEAVQGKYAQYDPMSTSIIGMHNAEKNKATGKTRLVLERHGSLHFDHIQQKAQGYGFDLVLGPKAQNRLPRREY